MKLLVVPCSIEHLDRCGLYMILLLVIASNPGSASVHLVAALLSLCRVHVSRLDGRLILAQCLGPCKYTASGSADPISTPYQPTVIAP